MESNICETKREEAESARVGPEAVYRSGSPTRLQTIGCSLEASTVQKGQPWYHCATQSLAATTLERA